MFTVIQIDRPDIVTTEMKKLSLSSQEPFTLFICLLINCISLFLVARFTKQIFEWIELSESPFIPQISNQINKISAALFVYIIVPMVCIPSSRQLKKYKIFVLPGWISGNIFMPPIVAFHEIPLVLKLQVLSVAGRLYSNLYIL